MPISIHRRSRGQPPAGQSSDNPDETVFNLNPSQVASVVDPKPVVELGYND